MKKLALLLVSMALLWAVPSWGQPSSRSTPISCSVAELAAGTCAPARLGTRVRVRNSDASPDANCASGTGANAIICEYNGTNWVSAFTPGLDLIDWDDIIDAMTLDAETTITVGTDLGIIFDADDFASTTEQILTFDIDHADDTDATDVVHAIKIDLNTASTDAGDVIGGIIINQEDAAGVVDYGIKINNADTTGSSMSDGILITSTGVNGGVADAIDASAANITNAINVGTNYIAGGSNNSLLVGYTADTLTFRSNGTATATFLGLDSAGAANTALDTTGAGQVIVGSDDVTAINLVTAGDVYITDQADGNQDAHAQLIALPKVAGWSVGASTDGSETVNTDFGDSETPATDWTAVDGDVTVSNDGSVYRKGSASLKMVVAGSSVETDDGATNALASGDQDWTDDESFGMWMRCDTTTSAGDWTLAIVDSVAGTTDVNIPALTTANTWTWLEVDISGVANASKDVITDLGLTLSAAGATAMLGKTCQFDYMWKWDAAEEEALSQSILDDGILAAFYLDTDAANVIPGVLTEGTNFIIHYESGNDFFIAVDDQSGNSVWGMAALE